MYENSSKSFLFSEMLIRQRLKDKFLHEFWFPNLLKRSANKQKQLYFDLKVDWNRPATSVTMVVEFHREADEIQCIFAP